MAVPGRTEERSVARWRARRGDHGGYRRAQAGARLRRSRLDDQADRLRPSPRARERALLATVQGGTAVPRCACGGPWKPATISFGQALVEADLARSLRTAATADLFVAAGTSLVVGPVNQMFAIAARAGARTAILTASETPYDADADVKLGEPVEQVLPALRDRVVGR